MVVGCVDDVPPLPPSIKLSQDGDTEVGCAKSRKNGRENKVEQFKEEDNTDVASC